MAKKKVFFFGNEYVDADSAALKIADLLKEELEQKNLEVVKTDSVNQVLHANLKEPEKIIIVDVAKNVKDVTVINDLDQIKETKSVSLHDFDLGFTLKLIKQLGSIKDFSIICVPDKREEKEIEEMAERVKEILLS